MARLIEEQQTLFQRLIRAEHRWIVQFVGRLTDVHANFVGNQTVLDAVVHGRAEQFVPVQILELILQREIVGMDLSSVGVVEFNRVNLRRAEDDEQLVQRRVDDEVEIRGEMIEDNGGRWQNVRGFQNGCGRRRCGQGNGGRHRIDGKGGGVGRRRIERFVDVRRGGVIGGA